MIRINMKINLKQLGTLLVLCLLTFSASAAVLVQDNFDSYSQGLLPTNSPANPASPWFMHSGTASTGIVVVGDPTGNSPNALQVSQALTLDVHANLATNATLADITIITSTTNIVAGVSTNITYTTNYSFSASNSVSTLYSKYTIYVTTVPPGNSETYFGHFYVDSSTFKGKLFLVTNGVATPGTFRIAIQNTGSVVVTNTIPVDLTANTVYTLVTRYVLSTGSNTVWLNPANETSGNSATPLDAASTGNILAYAFRQASTGEGILDVDNFVVGTRFADVVPGSVNPPTILTQPQDTNVFSGSSAVFSTLAAGDDTLGYQWFSVTNSVTNGIAGATGKTLTLTSLATNQTGSIFCVVTNGAGTNTTRLAQLLVSQQSVPPTIDTNITPSISTNTIGDTVTFTVVAHGLPPPAYQWKFVPANSLVTNIVAGVNASGTNTATLTLMNLTTNQAGSYFVTITNSSSVGYMSTNSALAVLKVTPPPFLSIAALRGLEDPVTWSATNTTALYTIQGIVTTWTNMSTSGNSDFYIQDSSGGIAVFWLGAPASTNLPPAGALVQVTGPLANFSGLLEIEPVFTNQPLQNVVVLSTGNPLPTPQPLPFDPNMQNNPATMEKLEGSYFVASNVMLNLSTPTFAANASDPTTNLAYHVLSDTNAVYNFTFTNDVGQTFILFVNSHTDIPGQTKPTGPVTIYGVLGQFVSSSPYIGGYEFTPSRYADIISYVHAINVLSNVNHWGDALTNTFTESFLEPGETLATYVSIGDPEGGTVSLTPITAGLPGDAYWDGITSGATATAVFHFSPTSADAGSNYVVALASSSTSGTVSTNYWNVYVPTPTEQKIAITEFLANPTTNTSAPNFNPLHRNTDTIGIVANDQYIEVANLSDTGLGSGWTIDKGNALAPIFDSNGGGVGISSSNAIVIYGGNLTESPNLPVPSATTGSLLLPTSGTGVIILRNQNGYIIDRVVYSASNLSSNSSLSRFPTANGPFVPQAYISTNYTTAGLQYDGGSWGLPTKVPTGVTGVVISMVNGQAVLHFTANTSLASTLWSANNLTDPFQVVFGRQFSTSSGVFTVTNLPPTQQFYFITTQ
jgi:hypothetical protein